VPHVRARLNVRVVADRIGWTTDWPMRGKPHRMVGEWSDADDSLEMWLHEFTRLAAADEHAFVTFSKRYGVLGLSPVLPGESNTGGVDLSDAGGVQRWVPCGLPPRTHEPSEYGMIQWHWEPLMGWRAYANEAMSILRAARALHDGEFISNATL